MRHIKSMRYKTTRKQRFQKIWHDYERVHGTEINDPEAVALWAIETGRFDEPPASPLQRCKRELTRAIRDEYVEDAKGRRGRVTLPLRVNLGI